MKESGKFWKYVAVYTNDLDFVVRDPARFVNELENEYKYKSKDNGSISFHLVYDFFRNEDVTLCMAPRKHIEKMIDVYKNMFNEKPPGNFKSPL